MKGNKINTNKLKINKFMYVIVFFFFFIFALTLVYRCLVDYKATDKMTISEFIQNRNINEEILLPERGTIYDRNGNVLAQDVTSYTLIAYLDESRSKNSDVPRHVVDKEMTAHALEELIDTDYERILEILNKDAYQVEFGTGGKNLSQLEMEEIAKLKLPGIDFIKSIKRYYPNGDFASYLLGYTKNKEMPDGNTYMVGELGIEGYYNEELTGKSGYIKYERDGRGNKIANSNEYVLEAVNGSDIYLTIDSNIQLFIENEVKKAQEESHGEWVVMGIMDAKTGALLGYSSTPSFDPNIRNMTNYLDPLISYAYEPGSTMKTFSYMCAVNSGKYSGSDTYLSGSKTYVSELDENDTVTINDWNRKGWGRISYDFGFAMSSNIGVANLLENVISKKELRACYEAYGFGKETGISLNNEVKGNIKFTYDIEAATAGYGQGIEVTPIQMLQGYGIIGNNGVMLKPYVVNKVVSSDKEVILENSKQEGARVASTETIAKMKSLLRSVIGPDGKTSTGSAYYMEDYDLIGKTGTASIYENGRYLTDGSEYIYSFAGLYPGDNPEIVIYMAIKKPQDGRNYIAGRIKDIVRNTSKYLSINEVGNTREKVTLTNYQNKVVTEVKSNLESKGIKTIVLGTGNKIVKQYPSKGIDLYSGDTVILLTNDYNKTMINFMGLSYKDATNVLNLMGVEYTLSGYGYAVSQNIEAGEKIDKRIEIEFKKPY